MDLDRPSLGKIAAGQYTKEISATIDPLWPSSVRIPPHAKGFGRVKYEFIVKFGKLWLGQFSPSLSTSQEVWVLNSTLPPPLPSIGATSPPLVVQTSWKKSTLPVSLTLPSETLTLGQIVPVKVQMSPFTNESKYAGQTIDVLKASFILREHVHGQLVAHSQEFDHSRDVISVPITQGWPCTTGPWERIVNLTLPTSPELSASTKTRCLNISYSLILVMKLKAGSQKDKKASDYELHGMSCLTTQRRDL